MIIILHRGIISFNRLKVRSKIWKNWGWPDIDQCFETFFRER